MRLVLILLVLTCPSIALAKEAQKTPQEKPSTCEALEEKIQKSIEGLGDCWEDKECIQRDMGCPWQVNPCAGVIVSTIDDNKKITALESDMRTYDKDCVQKNAALKRQCADFSALQSSAQCPPESKPALVCISGKCVNQVRALFQGDKNMLPSEDGVAPGIIDIFKERMKAQQPAPEAKE